MKKILLATAAAAALTVGATAANAQYAPWAYDDGYGYGPTYSYGQGMGYTYRPYQLAVPGEFVDDPRTGLKNGS